MALPLASLVRTLGTPKRVTEKVCISLPLATHQYNEDNEDSKKSLMTFQDIFTTDLAISLLVRTLKGSSVGQWRIKKLKEKFKPSLLIACQSNSIVRTVRTLKRISSKLPKRAHSLQCIQQSQFSPNCLLIEDCRNTLNSSPYFFPSNFMTF